MKYWGDQWSKSMYPSTFEGKNDKGEALAGTVKSYDTSNWKGQTYLVSWYGRANYSLLDRYLLTFTARYDGSSRFADTVGASSHQQPSHGALRRRAS